MLVTRPVLRGPPGDPVFAEENRAFQEVSFMMHD